MIAYVVEFNNDGTQGQPCFEVTNFCGLCHRGLRSWFHGQGNFRCYFCDGKPLHTRGPFDLATPFWDWVLEELIDMDEILPAVVIHCTHIDTRKCYYIQILEGPPSSNAVIIFDEYDQNLPDVLSVKLEYNDVAERYTALVTCKYSVLHLNVIGTVPWQRRQGLTMRESEMTEWLKLERLKDNDLPIPQYETEHSAGVDFAACLTRPCKYVPSGTTHREAKEFMCAALGGKARFRLDEGIPSSGPPVLQIDPQETIMIPLGWKSEFGSSYVLNLHVRSSVGLSGLILANGTAIIDPDYRGELFVAVYNRNTTEPIIIEHGKRIVQGVMLQHKQAVITEEKVGTTVRGEGGFGSTGELAALAKATDIDLDIGSYDAPEYQSPGPCMNQESDTMTETNDGGCCQNDPSELADPNAAELAEAGAQSGCCKDEIAIDLNETIEMPKEVPATPAEESEGCPPTG